MLAPSPQALPEGEGLHGLKLQLAVRRSRVELLHPAASGLPRTPPEYPTPPARFALYRSVLRTLGTVAALSLAPLPARGRSDKAVVRQRRDAALHALRLQPGGLSRQGGRPERLSPVAARLRPRDGLPVADARVQRPAHLHRRSRGEPAAAQAGRPGRRTRAAKSSTSAAGRTRCCSTGFAPARRGRIKDEPAVRTGWRSLPGDRTLQAGRRAAAGRPRPSTATAARAT